MTRDEVIGWLEGYTANRRTICEVFREIYDIVYEMPDPDPELDLDPELDTKKKLVDLIVEGFGYGKKMTNKMVKNKKMLIELGKVEPKANMMPKNKNKAESKVLRANRGRTVLDE